MRSNRVLIAFVAFMLGAICATMLGGCAPRTVVRERSVVYVDEAELVRASIERAWLATAFVHVTALDPDEGGSGSGVIVDRGPVTTLVLTARHVIDTGDSFRVAVLVTAPGEMPALAIVDREDAKHDLAMLRVLARFSAEPLRLASTPPKHFERVWALGAPDSRPGHVGNARWGGVSWGWEPGLVARSLTGGFVWDGMSGGPVIDERGRLVGVVDSVHLADAVGETDEDEDPQVRVPEMGSAVDWHNVRDFLKEAGL